MKSAPFQYYAPETVDEAISILSQHGDEAKVLAGGQSLLPLLALRLARPSVLVDVGRIADLKTIDANGSLRLGAMTSQRTAERSAEVLELCPLLHRALPLIAHRAIRTRGTIGGSLAHADPAAELPAVAMALDAELVARGPKGEQVVSAADFFQGYLTTTLAADDVLVEVRIPSLPAGSGVSFLEVSRRHGDFALVGCAAALSFNGDGSIADARLAFTGVDSVPLRASAAEGMLRGATPGDELWADAAAAVSAAIEPSGDIHATAAYRKHVAGGADAPDIDRSGRPPRGTAMTTRMPLDLTVNGRTQTVLVEPRTTLADAMRQEMGLTGTHLACEHGVCGACTVLADGEPVRSCLMLAVQAAGVSVTTVEGIATDGVMHPIQEAMWDAHSFQCGFCTPGFVITAAALLADNPAPTEAEVREELSGNLCRCTGYQSIIDGVLLAAARMRGESGEGILPTDDH